MTKPRHFFFRSKSRRFSMAIPNKKRKRKEVRRKDEEIQTDNLLKPQVIDKDAPISNVVDDSKPLSKFDLHLQHKLSDEDTGDRGMQINLNKDNLSSTIANDDGSKDKLITSKAFVNLFNHPSLTEELMLHWGEVNQEYGGLYSEHGESISTQQVWFFDQCSTYRDILFANKTPFYLEGSEDVDIMGAYIVHALNHVFRTRDCIDKNDAKIAELGADVDSERFQDQGFTRPKVLILLPFASIMYDVVMSLIKLTPSAEVDEESLKLFSDKYGGEEQKDSKEKGQEPDNEDPKPEDFKLLFKGNSDEKFITGIQFTGTTIKLSDDLFSSDFIIASPCRLVDVQLPHFVEGHEQKVFDNECYEKPKSFEF
ncbi:U3 small nucleolar RNA-associated-like protein [Medicago truncatula]|uniref:U3 small nucleolar RNA-associated-like protein n=1 Tax=Medicago truncatula TaxID=3880 RepID=A0A072TR41_MEDTR|nr:U3 small nucleolar RNA-associated-like protein [Medicago truncatula]